MNNEALVELLVRFGPAGPLKNRVMVLLALDTAERGLVDPDVRALAMVCRVKRNSMEQVLKELVIDGWLEADSSGYYLVNPFPACARGARVERGLRAHAHSVLKTSVGTALGVPTGSTLKVSPVSPTLAFRTTFGSPDCKECGGTGWVDTADGSVKGCACRGQNEALQGQEPAEHPSAEGHAEAEGAGT